MQRLRVHGPGDIRLQECFEPVPGDRDVVIQTVACGICGSDLSFIRIGTVRPDGAPQPLGHEVSGVVAAIGRDVAGLKPGMRVVVNPMAKTHDPDVPDADDVLGCGGDEGAFGQHFLIRDARPGEDIVEIPADVTFEQAALSDPLGVAAHAINQGRAASGDRVVIFGAGPIGLAAVLWLRRRHIEDVVVVDLHAARLRRAMDLGARAVIDASCENVWDRLGELHGSFPAMGNRVVGSDLYLEMAGGEGIFRDIIKGARPHARVVIVAAHFKDESIPMQDLLLKELQITSSLGYPTEFGQVVAALPELTDQLGLIISHRYDFEEIFDAFSIAGSPDSAKVMINFSG